MKTKRNVLFPKLQKQFRFFGCVIVSKSQMEKLIVWSAVGNLLMPFCEKVMFRKRKKKSHFDVKRHN